MFYLPEKNISLRAFRGEDDLGQIISMHNDQSLASLMSIHYVVPQGSKLKEEYKKNIEDNAEIFCIIEEIPVGSFSNTPRFVGFAGLFGTPEARLRRESGYAIAIRREYWNKGYGKAVTKHIVRYAFENLFMHRIWLGTVEGNDRALAVYKKCGFVLEGMERKAVMQDGKWKDIMKLSMIIDDWIEMNKPSSLDGK